MYLSDLIDIYYLINTRGLSNDNTIKLRKKALQKPLVKIAFDTRRIDQGQEIIPRRGLQNYHRSQDFITEGMSQRIKYFTKLQKVLQDLQSQYQNQPAWQDSYARLLLSSLDKGLRTNIKDDDFTDSQPGTGSLDYLEELLQVRYRLTLDDLINKSPEELKEIILSKDSELDSNIHVSITKRDISNNSYGDLIEKLFGGIRASKDNPHVERTVTIKIEDSYLDK